MWEIDVSIGDDLWVDLLFDGLTGRPEYSLLHCYSPETNLVVVYEDERKRRRGPFTHIIYTKDWRTTYPKWRELVEWYESGDKEALFHWLLKEVS